MLYKKKKKNRGCATLWPLLGRLAKPLFLLTWEFPRFKLQHMPDSHVLSWMYVRFFLVLNSAFEVTIQHTSTARPFRAAH